MRYERYRKMRERTPAPVERFADDHRFLSNFWPARVTYDGFTYPTVEHAYQAAKVLPLERRHRIQNARTPGEAKRLGRSAVPRPDWDQERLGVMRNLVRQKFAGDARLGRKLLATGDARLIEGNTWGDKFWGVCDGEGENHLGRILMDVRSELETAGI